MNQIELLKKLPKEHWTEHKGKAILIKDLIKLLIDEENTNNGVTGRGEDHARQAPSRDVGRRSFKRRRNKKRDS